MIPPLEIFRIEKDGTPVWCESAGTFEAAKSRIELLSGLMPSQYMVLNRKTGQRKLFPTPAPSGGTKKIPT